MCLYDLSKAFDSVVLLQRLFDAGINGKLWRLMRDWYSRALCAVKGENGRISNFFDIGRGVKQGSVLSPTLC